MEMILPSLYPHQETFVADVRESLRVHRRSIACGVTGFGKSRIAKWILGACLQKEPTPQHTGRVLFAVHRRGLVDNICQVLDQSPSIPYGVIMSGADTNQEQRLQVASIDTLLSWYCEDGAYRSSVSFDVIIYDETHSHLSKLKTFLMAHDTARCIRKLSTAYVLGLTATPECQGIADTYKHIVTGPKPAWLQEHGYASRFRYLTGKKGRLGLLVKQGDRFTNASQDEAMKGLQGDFVRDWKTHASERPTIGFFPLLAHAREAQELLLAAGVQAEYVDGNTPDEERRAMYRGLQRGDFHYLCNVGVVERGTDIPAASCIQLCTAIGSRVRYLQMIGRGARVCEGKVNCLVLDHGDNVRRHGCWEDDIPWILDNSSKASKEHPAKPVIECPQCQAIYRGGKCRQCGYEPSKDERQQQGLAFDGSELKEYKPPAKPKQNDPEKLFISCLYRCGKSGKTWKQACGMFVAIAKKDGLPARVPNRFTVGGREYKSIPYGHPEGGRRLDKIYDFIR